MGEAVNRLKTQRAATVSVSQLVLGVVDEQLVLLAYCLDFFGLSTPHACAHLNETHRPLALLSPSSGQTATNGPLRPPAALFYCHLA